MRSTYTLSWQAGDRFQVIHPSPDLNQATLKTEVTAALQRLTPGFLKTVGLVTPPQPTLPPQMRGRAPMPQGPRYQFVKSQLEANYTVKEIDLKDGWVAGDIDVLMVLGGQQFDDKQRFAIDQFLMRGGSVVLCAGAYGMNANAGPSGANLSVTKQLGNVNELITHWGIEVEDKLVLDPQNEAFPVPVERNIMGLSVREIRMLDYPFWVDVRPDGLSEESPIVAGIPAVTLQWVSPLKLTDKETLTYTVLMRSTKNAWTQSNAVVAPNFALYPQKGFGRDDQTETAQQTLAVAATGTFTSAFSGKKSPLLSAEKTDTATAATAAAAQAPQEASSVIAKSSDSARLIVIGSSDFLRDAVLGLSRQTGSDRFTNNLQLGENMLDWAVADTDLLGDPLTRHLRTHAAAAKRQCKDTVGAGQLWHRAVRVIHYRVDHLGSTPSTPANEAPTRGWSRTTIGNA